MYDSGVSAVRGRRTSKDWRSEPEAEKFVGFPGARHPSSTPLVSLLVMIELADAMVWWTGGASTSEHGRDGELCA